MNKSKKTMRQAILCRLYDHLEQHYGLNLLGATFLDGSITDHELEAILAFKSDPWLEDLRSALERIAEGTYGICISCKMPLPQKVLSIDPVQRICGRCESKMSHAMHQGSSDLAV